MFQLVYVSETEDRMPADDLVALLAQSREKNARLGVTGILLYKDRRFMQVLEGDEQTVRDLYETIKRDERHTNVRTVIEGNIDDREFGEWAMGFPNINAAAPADQEGVSQFMEGKFTREELQAQQTKIQALLKVFKGLV